MESLLRKVNFQVNEKIFLKDPESSDLGHKIISGGIELIEELGYEAFTFNKLGKHIGSPEASIYRYFESKQKLLLYLISWYWSWLEYQLVFAVANIPSPEEKLRRAINLLTQRVEEDGDFTHINEKLLHQIVISESTKAYLNKEVDKENKRGLFIAYKQLVERVSNIILEINPVFEYPHMLVSTVIEGAHLQRYFTEHLPGLTDQLVDGDATDNFYSKMVFKTIK